MEISIKKVALLKAFTLFSFCNPEKIIYLFTQKWLTVFLNPSVALWYVSYGKKETRPSPPPETVPVQSQ